MAENPFKTDQKKIKKVLYILDSMSLNSLTVGMNLPDKRKRTEMKMKNQYVIEVRALGYDTTQTVVEAENLREAKKSERKAISEWLAHNDVDYSTRGLASVRYLASTGGAK
jgi:hypothetical protein